MTTTLCQPKGKMTAMFVGAALALMSATVPALAAGRHEQASFCQTYAKKAVADEKFNQAEGCFSDWKVHSVQEHYNWCMSKSGSSAAEQQQYNRARMIASCSNQRIPRMMN